MDQGDDALLTAAGEIERIVETFNDQLRLPDGHGQLQRSGEDQRTVQQDVARENKSHVIARLMAQAVEERRIENERARAIDAVLERRASRKTVSSAQVRKVRAASRP